jgi:hypothetical protein
MVEKNYLRSDFGNDFSVISLTHAPLNYLKIHYGHHTFFKCLVRSA